jgi:hypothetical protein
MLWQDRIVGWGNLSVRNGEVDADFGYIDSRPARDAAFRRELGMEVERMRVFLAAPDPP